MATNNIEMKRTAKGCGYWNETGAYQQEYDELWRQLVPLEGEAQTTRGEVLRTASKLYYDFFNNGNMNACEIVGGERWLDDDDEEVYDTKVSEYYQGCLNFLRRTCKDDYELMGLLERVRDIIVMGEDGCNDADNEHTYDLMADHCIYWVLTHDDSEVNPFAKINH